MGDLRYICLSRYPRGPPMCCGLVAKDSLIRDIFWIGSHLRVTCLIGTTVSSFCPGTSCGVGNDRFHPGLPQLVYFDWHRGWFSGTLIGPVLIPRSEYLGTRSRSRTQGSVWFECQKLSGRDLRAAALWQLVLYKYSTHTTHINIQHIP